MALEAFMSFHTTIDLALQVVVGTWMLLAAQASMSSKKAKH